MSKRKNPPDEGRLGDLVLIDKKGLIKLLHDYESGVKEKDEILPFADRYFEQMRRLNMGVK